MVIFHSYVSLPEGIPCHHQEQFFPSIIQGCWQRVPRVSRGCSVWRVSCGLPHCYRASLACSSEGIGSSVLTFLKRVRMRPKKDNVGWGIRDLCEVWWRFKDLIYAIYGIFMVFFMFFFRWVSVFFWNKKTSWLNLTLLTLTRWPEAVGCWLPDFVRQEVASRLRISWPGEWVANGWQHISTYINKTRHVNAETPRKPRNAFPPWKMA